ncbi:hypothetical protein [Streptomyces sp. NPDC005181]
MALRDKYSGDDVAGVDGPVPGSLQLERWYWDFGNVPSRSLRRGYRC